MVRHICSLNLIIAVCLGAGGCLRAPGEQNEDNDTHDNRPIRLELSSSTAEYLLGEPVVLRLALTNCLDFRIVVPESVGPPYSGRGVVEYSSDGITWRTPGAVLFTDCRIGGDRPTLMNQETRQYTVRLFGCNASPLNLALDRPGTYFIKVSLPAQSIWPTPAERHDIDSNVVTVKVKKPEGDEAKVWEVIRDQRIVSFLNRDFDGNDRAAMKVMDVVSSYPRSSYRSSLRSALRDYCYYGCPGLLAAEQQRLKSTLGIQELCDFVDQRLDQRIKFRPERVGTQSTLAELLELLSNECNVPMGASADLLLTPVGGWMLPVTLKGRMASLSFQCKASWNRHGDTYFLSRPTD